MDSRELVRATVSAALFLAIAIGIAITVPAIRPFDPALLVGLLLGYALVMRVRFEVTDSYVSAEQLVFVPILLLLPLPFVPIVVAAAAVIATAPDVWRGAWHWQRCLTAISDCWFCLGPVVVLRVLAPGAPGLEHAWVYVLAFASQLACDFVWSVVIDRLGDRIPMREFIGASLATARIDAILAPIAFAISLVAFDEPAVLLVIGPLVWLLQVFSRDRRERYTATLELNRAYRGTVMLLADVVEYEDGYTARHSRSVVELVQAVAERMGIDDNSRQELEFAALLHDVGKISIPEEILHKPGKLTADEFELIKTHTIEGQFMLDRVGGVLARVGEIVRSCHERVDGGGYPDGLVGEEIPLAARIVFVCDALNAMTTDRPYREAMTHDAALAELARHAGTQFDPDVVVALTEVIEQGEPEPGSTDEMRALLASVRVPRHAAA